jgi:hypothetical protein
VIVSPIKAAEAAALLGINLATMTSDELSAAFRPRPRTATLTSLGLIHPRRLNGRVLAGPRNV